MRRLSCATALAALALFICSGNAYAAGAPEPSEVEAAQVVEEENAIQYQAAPQRVKCSGGGSASATLARCRAKGVTRSIQRLQQAVAKLEARLDHEEGVAAAKPQTVPQEVVPVAEPGSTQEGMFSIAPGTREVINFPVPLAASPSAVHVIERDKTSPECPGVGADAEHPQATAGNLCLYLRESVEAETSPELMQYGTAQYCDMGRIPYLNVWGIGYGQPWGDYEKWLAEENHRKEMLESSWTEAELGEWCQAKARHETWRVIPGSYNPATGQAKYTTSDGLSRFGFDLRLNNGGCCGGNERGVMGVWAVTP